jgi:hypothetical protein
MQNNQTLQIEFDSDQLTAKQAQLIKSINMIIGELLTSKSEQEFFDCSRFLFDMATGLIQSASFPQNQEDNHIEYSTQALEFALEKVQNVIDKIEHSFGSLDQ